MKNVITIGILMLLLASGFVIFESFRNTCETGELEKMKESSEYTPSQNLAIKEGRFEDARISIKEIEEEMKW